MQCRGDQDPHLTPAVVKPSEEAAVWTHTLPAPAAVGFPTTSEIFQVTLFLFF